MTMLSSGDGHFLARRSMQQRRSMMRRTRINSSSLLIDDEENKKDRSSGRRRGKVNDKNSRFNVVALFLPVAVFLFLLLLVPVVLAASSNHHHSCSCWLPRTAGGLFIVHNGLLVPHKNKGPPKRCGGTNKKEQGGRFQVGPDYVVSIRTDEKHFWRIRRGEFAPVRLTGRILPLVKNGPYC
jgi:hypothetical protein